MVVGCGEGVFCVVDCVFWLVVLVVVFFFVVGVVFFVVVVSGRSLRGGGWCDGCVLGVVGYVGVAFVGVLVALFGYGCMLLCLLHDELYYGLFVLVYDFIDGLY